MHSSILALLDSKDGKNNISLGVEKLESKLKMEIPHLTV